MKTLIQLGAFALLAIIALAMCDRVNESTQPQAVTDGITQKGFFKDDLGNRVYTLEIQRNTTAAQVQSNANGLVSTAGHPTAAYYYIQGARMPIDGVTLAKDFMAASAAIDTPGLSRPTYIFIRGFNGRTTFADCLSNPSDSICQPAK